MTITQPTQTDFRVCEDKIYGCRSSKFAKAVLKKFGIDWQFIAVLRLGQKYDAIAGRARHSVGIAEHYLDEKHRLVATYSQTKGALTVFVKPKKQGKLLMKGFNIREGERK